MILLVFIVASDTVVLTIAHIDELSGVVIFFPLAITTKDGANRIVCLQRCWFHQFKIHQIEKFLLRGTWLMIFILSSWMLCFFPYINQMWSWGQRLKEAAERARKEREANEARVAQKQEEQRRQKEDTARAIAEKEKAAVEKVFLCSYLSYALVLFLKDAQAKVGFYVFIISLYYYNAHTLMLFIH